jgi:6-phosphogluconolactonase (cycloisomerase 2 family)
MTIPERSRRRLWPALALAILLSLAAAPAAHGEQFVFASNSGALSGKESVTPFTVNADGSLTPHPVVPAGIEPQGITVTPDARFVYVATNKGVGARGWSIGPGGNLTEVPGSPYDTKGPHASGAAVSPSGDWLVISNRGNEGADPGSIAVFEIDPGDGSLTMVKGAPFPITGLEDPSRLAISPDGTRVLATGDAAGATFDPRVAVFDIDPSSGELTQVPGSPFASGSKQAVPIVVSPDGGRVFVGNIHATLGHTITVLSMNQQTGALTPVPGSPVKTAGTSPIGLGLAPDGSRLFSAERPPQGGGERGVSVYNVTANPPLTAVPGSPFPGDGAETRGTVVAPDGRAVYAIASEMPGAVLGYAIGGGGALTPLPGSPYPTGDQFSGAAPITITPSQTPQPAFTAASTELGEATAFDASATEVPGGRATRFDWDFGDGGTLLDGGAKPSHTYAKVGSYSVTLTVTNDCAPDAVFTGNTVYTGQTASCRGPRTAALTRPVTISDTTAPVISGVKLAKRFAAGSKPTAKSSKVKKGTKISYSLSEEARTRIAFQKRSGTGKRSRFRNVGVLTRSGKKGRNSIRFSGRIGNARPLSAGRYRVVLTATDSSGNRSKRKQKGFRIVPPRG